MSIDLFFAGALFLCASQEELRGDVKRVVFAIGISALCFLLYIHCALGYSRSAAVVVAWLLYNDAAQTIEEAVEQ